MSVPPSRWLMRGLLLLALAFANLNDVWSPDVIPNALLAWTLVRDGDVDYDEFVFRPGAPVEGRLDSEAYFFRACGVSTATDPPRAPRSRGGPPAPGPNDRVCSVFPPGMGLLALPFFLPAVLAGAAPLDLGLLLRVGHLASATIEAIATLLLWAVLRRFVSERWALALVLVYFLGTSVRTVASQALWQHAGVHLALALALWLALETRTPSPARAALAGLVLGVGAIVRQTTAVVALGIGGIRPSSAIAAIAAALVGVVPLLAFNWLVFGSPAEQGYGVKPFDTSPAEGLTGLLLSPSRGLFVYEPWALIALAGLLIAWRRTDEPSRRVRGLLVPWLVLLGLYATYAEWWGGRVFGPRFLDDLAPVLVVGLAWAITSGLLARTAVRVVFWVCVAWSWLIFNAAALVYDQSWDTVPVNVNDDPSRLFSWSDPQWLSVLGDVINGGPRVVVALALTLLALVFLARVEGVLGRSPVLPSAR